MSDQPVVRFLDRTTPPHIFTLVFMASMSAMTMNVFLPALPEMAEHFDTPYAYIQLSVAVFLAVNGILQLFIGPLSDRFGRRPITLIGVVLFLFATYAAIHAPSVEWFLTMRAAQAAVVTSMVLSRAIVRDIYPGDGAAAMLAYVTMGMSLVPMLSPTLGGFLTKSFGWESSFWLLFATGVALLILVFFDVGETAPKSSGSIGEMFGAFPELLTSQRFLGYALATTFSSGAFFAFLGGAPFIGTTQFGLTEDTLGLYIGAPAVGYFFGNFLSARLSTRIGINRMALIGGVLTTFGIGASLALSVSGHITANLFFGSMIFLGFGNGLLLPNSMTGSMSVRPNLAGTSAGLGGAMMIGGGAALSAFAGLLLNETSGATPLLLIMFSVSCLSVVSMLWVIKRARQLGVDA